MKSLLTLLLLSSAWMACAQDYASPEPVEIGKELSRTTFVVYPTAEEAAAGYPLIANCPRVLPTVRKPTLSDTYSV